MDTEQNLNATQQVLSTIDYVLSTVAVLGVAGYAAWWMTRLRCDPLAAVPARINSVREDGLAGVMIVYLLAAVAAAKIAEIFGADPESHFVRLTAGSSAQIVGIAACLFVAARAFPGGVRTFLLGTGETRPAFIAVLTLAALMMVIGVCPLVLRASIAIIESFIPGYEFAPHPTITALHESDSLGPATMVLWASAVIVAPAGEEIFFRGLLQTFLVNLSRNRWIAILITAAAFSVVHLSQVYAMPALLILAVVMGYLYERTGSLVPPFLMHAGFNLKTLVWDSLGAA